MILKPGLRLRVAGDSTEVIVVKAPPGDVDVRCGGLPMTAGQPAEDVGTLDPALLSGTALGKRYADEELGIELLCVKGGTGSLSTGSQVLAPKDAKVLPSSD